jgi:hypothetical protein
VSGDHELTVKADVLGEDVPPSIACLKERQTAEGRPVAAATLLPASLLIIAVAATAGGVSLLRSPGSSWLAPAAFVTGSFFFIASAVVLLGVIRERSLETEEKRACERDCVDLYWALNGIEDRTLKGLAWVNFKQLRAFTGIAQRQARMSYYASLAAAAISLLVLTTGAAVAIGLPVTTAKVTAGALAAAGTVLSGFLVKTFLKAYQMASRQMSYYYGQPLVHCYLLHAEWLASEARQQFGDKEGLSLLQEVIDASIKAGTDAQDHLLRMQEHDFERRRTRSAHRPTTPHHENMSQQPPVPDTVGSLSGARHEMV